MSFLKSLAHILSVIFHPLFLFTYILIILLMVNPYEFGVNTLLDKKLLIIKVFLSTMMIPMIGVFMMQRLGFIKSILMKDRMDRVIPYIVTGTFYIATYYILLHDPHISGVYKMFMLGGIIALFIAFFINNFSKISIHGVGMGGLIAVLLILIFVFNQNQLNFLGIFSTSLVNVLLLILISSGMVGSARLYLKAHEPKDLWGGYLVGIASQFIALQLVF